MAKLVTVIDLGSNKIAAATAGIHKDGNVSPLALENLYSRGITAGDITDINKAAEDVSSIINKLRHRGRKMAKNVFVTTRGIDIKIDIMRGMIPLSKTPREITKKDVSKCLEIAAMVRLSLDRAVVEKIVKGFYIDGAAPRVRNPIGLYGIKLEAEVFIATGNQSKIQNITKCVDLAGLLLDGIYLSGIASSGSVLDEKEKKDGVLLLDIGDSLTEGLVFKNGALESFRIIDKGAGTVLDGNMRADKGKLGALLKRALSALPQQAPDGFSSIVVTGGGALLDGVIEETEKMFKCPARIGIVKNRAENLSSQDAIIHTSTVGLIGRIAKEYKTYHSVKNPLKRIFRKILDIYESYF